MFWEIRENKMLNRDGVLGGTKCFYVAQVPLTACHHTDSSTYKPQTVQVSRGQVQTLMSSATSFASCVFHFCQEFEEFWAYQELLEPFAARLSSCCSPELLPLLDLPGMSS